MKRIVIFSGTTEGRQLSERLLDAGAAHFVCVASKYGGELMRKDPLLSLQIGRMDAGEMKEFLISRGFARGGFVVDATHPYAAEATENIRRAAEALGCRYLRVVRQSGILPKEQAAFYENAASCAAALKDCSGNILLTTGSKELNTFCTAFSEETRANTYVRVLPTEESLTLCSNAGIDPRHIIAMHGPFSMEMNLATLLQYDIRHLVTKESGAAGGFEDKVRAAKAAGAFLHVIARPSAEEGLSVQEALNELLDLPAEANFHPEKSKLCVTLAGIGMGSWRGMTIEVKEAIENAEIIFGAERLLRGIRTNACCRSMYRPSDIIPVLETVRPRHALILFSGDSGFYSGARSMKEALLSWRKDLVIRTLPGISSVSALAAVAGESYDDAAVFSLHGRKSPHTMQQLMQLIRYHRKTFVLLSGDEDLRDLGSMLQARRIKARILLGSNLSGGNESVRELTPSEAASCQDQGILTALILHEAFERRPILPVLDDRDLSRELSGNRIPMTKSAIRHESLVRLALREGDVVYDIGSGTGSVALEIAAQDPSLIVYAFEKNGNACGLIQENIRRLNAGNITVIQGEAPEAFTDIETPDRVFIGGSGGRLPDILSALKARKHSMRCVLTAVTLETMEEAIQLLKDRDMTDPEMIQLQCAQAKEVGRYHLMQAHNPVLIVSFTLKRGS